MSEFPRYRCHKEVRAVKIARVAYTFDEEEFLLSVTLIPEGDGSPLKMPAEWFWKHNPQPGGYLVIYDNDYKSYSPAKPFEDGYTRIS